MSSRGSVSAPLIECLCAEPKAFTATIPLGWGASITATTDVVPLTHPAGLCCLSRWCGLIGAVEESIWAPRVKWCDSRAFWDTEDCSRGMLETDWARAHEVQLGAFIARYARALRTPCAARPDRLLHSTHSLHTLHAPLPKAQEFMWGQCPGCVNVDTHRYDKDEEEAAEVLDVLDSHRTLIYTLFDV